MRLVDLFEDLELSTNNISTILFNYLLSKHLTGTTRLNISTDLAPWLQGQGYPADIDGIKEVLESPDFSDLVSNIDVDGDDYFVNLSQTSGQIDKEKTKDKTDTVKDMAKNQAKKAFS